MFSFDSIGPTYIFYAITHKDASTSTFHMNGTLIAAPILETSMCDARAYRKA